MTRRAPAFGLPSLLVLALALAPATGATQALAEFGIEGMGVVSTRADETGATVSPDGRSIVFASNRDGGRGGSDLWQAVLRDGRWQDAAPLALNTMADEVEPAFSADGAWLYFASDRDGGAGGFDLYRASVQDGAVGAVQALPGTVNTVGHERAPMPSPEGTRLLLASDGHGGAGGLDLFQSRWSGDAWSMPTPLSALNTPADEASAAWLPTGVVVFERAGDGTAARLYLARCRGGALVESEPLALSFNTDSGTTRRPVPDWNAPDELLVAGSARAPRAGGLDLYRMRAPRAATGEGCD